MIIECLGGFREVGSNAVLINSGKENLLLDYGVNVETAKAPIRPKAVDAILLAHAHLDHSGSVPALFRKKTDTRVYSTAPTFDQSQMILKDSLKVARLKGNHPEYGEQDIERMKTHKVHVTYGQNLDIGKFEIHVLNAGHIVGSSMFLIEVEGKRILYTSDFNTFSSRLVEGVDINQIPKVDIAIMESTYSSRDHPDRKQTEKELIKTVKETIENGGTALIPAFAIGRSAEVMMALDSMKRNFPVYLDGMAKEATRIALGYPEFLKDPKALEKAFNNTTMINSPEARKKILKDPCAIITTGGCLDGGPAVQYLKTLWSDTKSSLIFTGFQIPKTAGRYLLDTGRFVSEEHDLKLKMQVHQLDFSGHCGRTQLFDFVNAIKPSEVIVMHGDNCQRFATELRGRFDLKAHAPVNGDKLKI